MKRHLFLIYFLLIAISIFADSYTPSLIVMDFKAIDGIPPAEADQFGEIVLNEFISYKIFDILEQSQFGKLTEELDLQSSGLTSDSIKLLGKELNADFILTGSVGLLNKKIIIYLRILATIDGSYFLSEKIETTADNAFKDVVALTKKTAYRLRQRLSGDFLSRIETLINLGKIQEYEELIAYAKNIGDYAFLIDSLEKEVADKARVVLMGKYLVAIKEDKISEAEFLLNELLYYKLDTAKAAVLLEQLQKKKNLLNDKAREELIETIDRLLKDKNYNAALNKIEILNLKYNDTNPEMVLDLNNRLNSLKAELLYIKAKNAFTAYNVETLSYLDSLFRINKIRIIIAEAIELDPSVDRYGKFLARVEKENEKIEIKEKKRQNNKLFAESGLRNLIYIQGGAGLNFISDNFFEYGAVNGVFPELYAGGSLYFTFTKNIRGVLNGVAGFTYGSSDITDGSVIYNSNFGQVSAYLEPGLSFINGLFDLQTGVGARFAFRWYESTQTVLGVESSKDGILFPLGPGVFISGRYNISQNIAVFIKLRTYTTWYSGFDWIPETSVSLGGCYGVR